jgi:hypothetical protein
VWQGSQFEDLLVPAGGGKEERVHGDHQLKLDFYSYLMKKYRQLFILCENKKSLLLT